MDYISLQKNKIYSLFDPKNMYATLRLFLGKTTCGVIWASGGDYVESGKDLLVGGKEKERNGAGLQHKDK